MLCVSFQKMRTNNMENSRSKNRRNKSHSKQKARQNTDSAGDIESQHIDIPSPTDRVRPGCLTTPVTSAGNIVDMQGSLDQGSAEKAEEEKNENKDHNKKDLNNINNTTKQEDGSDAKRAKEDLKDIKECKENINEIEDKTNIVNDKEQVLQKVDKSMENAEIDEHNQTKKVNLLKEGNQGTYINFF